MRRLSKLRFDALAGYIRNPYSIFFAEELDCFQAGDEKFLGLVSIDTSDNDSVATVLARDRRGPFRAVDLKINLPSGRRRSGGLRRCCPRRSGSLPRISIKVTRREGASPVCYDVDVTPKMVQDYMKAHPEPAKRLK
jgi:hypothetical protein